MECHTFRAIRRLNELAKSLSAFSIGVMMGRNSISREGVNIGSALAWHFIAMVSSMVTGSPSRCAGPSLCRYITADGALKVCIMVFELMYPVNRSIPTRAVSNGVPAWMIVMSSSPSVMLAVGAIYALLPYCDALQHAIRNAFSVRMCP